MVGNLKENFKSDTPNDKSCDSQYVAAGTHMYKMYTSVCVPQSVNIEYTCSDFYSPVAQSWAGFQRCTVSLDITYNVVLYVCLFVCAYNGTYIYTESWHYLHLICCSQCVDHERCPDPPLITACLHQKLFQ